MKECKRKLKQCDNRLKRQNIKQKRRRNLMKKAIELVKMLDMEINMVLKDRDTDKVWHYVSGDK